jgi:hypothetical protein
VPGSSHYQLLQVAPTASREELRQAFRQLSKRFHPDTTELPVAEAERAFQQLRQAYAVLSDPAARQRYDGELRHAAMVVAAATNLPPTAATMATNPALRARPPGVVRPDGVRRALSGGEWLALLLLGIALVFSLVLGVGMAWLRGAELIESPSWWPEARLQPTMPMPMLTELTEPSGLEPAGQAPPPVTNLPKPTHGSEASDAANPQSIESQLVTEQLASEQLASEQVSIKQVSIEQLSTEQLPSEQVSIEQVSSEQPRINLDATIDLAVKLNAKPNAKPNVTLNANGNNQ